MIRFPENMKTPCFVVDLAALRKNLAVLDLVRKRTGVKILLAQKAFSMFSVYPLIAETLDGCCASSPHEAMLAHEFFGKELHAFAAAYSGDDLDTLLPICDHIVFNSFSLWKRFQDKLAPWQGKVSFGLRCNPEHSEADTEIYSPCAPKSRLGIRACDFENQDLTGIEGLHFHALCQKNADSLERVLNAFEKRFAPYIPRMKWINFGGGHHITREDYDVDLLCRIIDSFRSRYGTETLYLEPGEAVALNAGSLFATVLDVTHNETDIAILDASAEAHMPDVLEMPYRPEITGAEQPGVLPYTYRLGGHSCLAGDVIGDYSFAQPLAPGSRIELLDMAIYSMVKTNTFNGLALPSIATYDPENGEFKRIRSFTYEDFKNRLS